VLSFLIILLALVPCIVLADDEAFQLVRDAEKNKSSYIKEAEDLIAHSEQMKHLYMLDAKKLADDGKLHMLQTFSKENQQPQTCGQQCGTRLESNQTDTKNKYLIFVSFSMPNESLKSLYFDSKNQNAILVVRGLKDLSFKKTASELQALKIAVQIDPNLFKEYQVTQVPTIVSLLEHNNFNAISGNVSFEYAKAKLSEIK